jgi:hypothetical protein
MHTKFWFEILKGRDTLEDLGVDERIILILCLECGKVDWIHLAHEGTSGELS